MDEYCCELQCIAAPRALVDGRACTQCRAYGYCKCACARDAVRSYTIKKLLDQVEMYRFSYSYVRYGVKWIDFFVARDPDLQVSQLCIDDWTYDGVCTLKAVYNGPLTNSERRVVQLFREAKCFRVMDPQEAVVDSSDSHDSPGPSYRRISLNLLPRIVAGNDQDAAEYEDD